MRIAIVGAGALGLYYGALLQRSGEDVRFLLRRDYEIITKQGLKVFSPKGDFTLPHVQGYLVPEDIGPVDLVLVGLKTFANKSFFELITPLVKEGTQILTLQNGLGNEETLGELFGEKRIIGGVAYLAVNRSNQGEVHHLGEGRIVLGEFKRYDLERIERLANIFTKAEIECHITDDLKRARWEKLVWNIPFNGICALLQLPVNRLLERAASRKLVREIMLEVISAANAQGLTSYIADEYADNMLEITENVGEYRPSMQIDRDEGRQLEITAIFRVPLEYGRRVGIEMLRVEMLATLLEQISPLRL